MSLARLAACALVAAALVASRPARAAETELGVGADWLVDDNATDVLATLAVSTRIAPRVSVGARFGAALVNDPTRLAIPIDARVRLRLIKAYVEGLAGVWLLTKEDKHVRLHVAAGAGLRLVPKISVGLEVGYLDPTSMIGARLAVAF
jgi:hypothetical protein